MKAVIAAGGKGTRLSSIANNIPKPMVLIQEKPILEHQINNLKENGIVDIILIIGYLGDVIKDYFKDGSKFGVNITYIEEREPLGTAGAFYYLKEQIDNDFIFLYGDLIFSIDFSKLIQFHLLKQGNITLFAHPNSHPFDSDIIKIDNENCVQKILKKNEQRNFYYHNIVNAGIYVLKKQILDKFLELSKKDFETFVLNDEIEERNVFAYISSEYVKDAGTPDRFDQVNIDYKNKIIENKNFQKKQKCIFFDRDGTINKYKGFLRNINDFELEEGVIECLHFLNNSDYLAIIISNQPVIARGEVTFDELDYIHAKLETLLGEKGVYVNKIYFCPHHPDSGFDGEIKELKCTCDCRKPNIGMIKKAQEFFNLDLDKCYVVGDTTVDIQTGKNAGVKTILVKTGLAGADKKYNCKPDFIINNISEITDIIKE